MRAHFDIEILRLHHPKRILNIWLRKRCLLMYFLLTIARWLLVYYKGFYYEPLIFYVFYYIMRGIIGKTLMPFKRNEADSQYKQSRYGAIGINVRKQIEYTSTSTQSHTRTSSDVYVLWETWIKKNIVFVNIIKNAQYPNGSLNSA